MRGKRYSEAVTEGKFNFFVGACYDHKSLCVLLWPPCFIFECCYGVYYTTELDSGTWLRAFHDLSAMDFVQHRHWDADCPTHEYTRTISITKHKFWWVHIETSYIVPLVIRLASRKLIVHMLFSHRCISKMMQIFRLDAISNCSSLQDN